MSAITYGVAKPDKTTTKRKSAFARFFAGFFDAMIESRMRRAMLDVKLHGHLLPRELEQVGWKLTERSEDSLPFVR